MNKIAGSVILKDPYVRFKDIIEGKGWADEEDLWQEAMEGIVKNWLLIEKQDSEFVRYKNHLVQEYIISDPRRMAGIFAEATQSDTSYDRMIDDIVTVAYLKKGARGNLNRFIRENVGFSGTKKREWENKQLTMTDVSTLGTDEEADEDRFVMTNVFDQSEDNRDIVNLAYHNVDTETVLKSICKLYGMDRMNFVDEDVPHLQELFLGSIEEVLSSDRGYSGVGPAGKERYREVDSVTIANEQWVIRKVLVERVANLKREFLEDILKDKPHDWDYEFPGREVEGGVSDYEQIRSGCYDILNRHFPDMHGQFFDEDGELKLGSRHLAYTEIFETYPDLYRLYDRRKVAFRRIRSILSGRPDEVLLNYEAKIIDYLMREKGQKRVF